MSYKLHLDKRALDELRRLIDDEGAEFPNAEYEVRERFSLTESDWRAVVEAYDA